MYSILDFFLTQDCTDIKQFSFDSPQMTEVNKFFDKVSSDVCTLIVGTIIHHDNNQLHRKVINLSIIDIQLHTKLSIITVITTVGSYEYYNISIHFFWKARITPLDVTV